MHLILVENVLNWCLFLLLLTYLAILPAAQHSSFWGIINPYLKDMGSMNVVKAAMNSKEPYKVI